MLAQKKGANSVTIHLREDRRHIKDSDLKIIKKKLRIPLNLEIAPTKEMLKISIKHKPNYVCIVPEKRSEVTTEGGLNLDKKISFLKYMIKRLKREKIRVSLFIEPKVSDIKKSLLYKVDCVELHTGKYCNLYNKKKDSNKEFIKIKNSANYAFNNGLEVHAGHGLTYKTAALVSKIDTISEFNIGHFIISESIFIGLGNVITKFKKIINK